MEQEKSLSFLHQDGCYVDRMSGTPQGGVVSPLRANIFLHVTFDKWMDQHYDGNPFERYADAIVVHCKTERQAKFLLKEIKLRFLQCTARTTRRCLWRSRVSARPPMRTAVSDLAGSDAPVTDGAKLRLERT
jgi:hypothetical protein